MFSLFLNKHMTTENILYATAHRVTVCYRLETQNHLRYFLAAKSGFIPKYQTEIAINQHNHKSCGGSTTIDHTYTLTYYTDAYVVGVLTTR